MADPEVDPQPPVVVAVGDRLRFSTQLLRQIDDAPDQRSRLVEVERIIRDVDGSLTLWLKNTPREEDVPLPLESPF